MTPAELKLWRRQHGKVTQAELASQLGVHVNTVNRWEAGTTEIPGFLGLALETLARRAGQPVQALSASEPPVQIVVAAPTNLAEDRASALLEARARIRARYGVASSD